MIGIIIKNLFIELPRSDSRRWPANILAVSRIAKVQGRMIFLIDSIKTIKFIRTVGVFIGTRWVNILFVFVHHP